MTVSKTTIKRARWKAANQHRNYPLVLPYNPQSLTMEIERFIDGDFVKLRVYSAPRHRAEQRTLERKIALASFIRKHWDNLTHVCPSDLPHGSKAVEEHIIERFDVLAIARPVAEIEPGIPPMMLLFFETDELAMEAMLKLP